MIDVELYRLMSFYAITLQEIRVLERIETEENEG